MDGLECCYKDIHVLCEIGAAKIVNTRHVLQSYLIPRDFHILLPSSLSFKVRSNFLPASTSLYLAVHSKLARGWAAGWSAKD